MESLQKPHSIFSGDSDDFSEDMTFSNITLNSVELEKEALRITEYILDKLGDCNKPEDDFDLYGKVVEILKKGDEITYLDVKRIFGVADSSLNLHRNPCFDLLCEQVTIH